MRHLVPIRKLFSTSTNTIREIPCGRRQRMSSRYLSQSKVTVEKRARIQEMTSGDLCSLAYIPPHAFKPTMYDHASGLMKSCSCRIPVRKFTLRIHIDENALASRLAAQANAGDIDGR